MIWNTVPTGEPYSSSIFIPWIKWHVHSVIYGEQTRCKKHTLATSERFSKSLPRILSYLPGKQEGELSLRDQVSGSTYVICSPGYRRMVSLSCHQDTYFKWLSTGGSMFAFILPRAGLSLLQISGRFHWLAGLVPWKRVPGARPCQCCQGPLFSPAPVGKAGVWTRLAPVLPWSDFAEMCPWLLKPYNFF